MHSYTYNNIKYYNSKFKIDCYKCYYEYFYSNNLYTVYLYNYEEDEYSYFVKNENLLLAKKLLKEKLKSDIKSGKINELIKNNFKILIDLPTILKDCYSGIGYHITNIKNKTSILSNGLIPNYIIDNAVCNASDIIDKNKPCDKFLNFERKHCVYLHPELDNYFFSQTNEYYKNSVLFAIDFSDITNNAIISSSGLGGFCLYEDDEKPNQKDLNKYAKQYWKYAKKIDEYITTDNHKTPYDYSEIIINASIPKEKITLIGYWDKNSKFHFNKNFIYFVKTEYKNNYKKILELYI